MNMRICIVAPAVTRPADVHAGCLALAEWLCEEKCPVTILCVLRDRDCNLSESPAHTATIGSVGVVFLRVQSECEGTPQSRVSYAISEWLKQEEFDVVHCSGQEGYGYFTFLEKYQGTSFRNTFLSLHIDEPTLRVREIKGEPIDNLNYLEADFFERRCAELADAVACSSNDVVDWMEGKYWVFSQRPEILPILARRSRQEPNSSMTDDCEDAEERWRGWFSAGLKSVRSDISIPLAQDDPIVTVCMVHHDRPQFLTEALRSISDQSYPKIELVLVDDGSQNPEAISYLNGLEEAFRSRGWRIVYQDNKYLGAARNAAASHATGQYLFFTDDDDILKPDAVRHLVGAAKATGAKIVTCAADLFSEQDEAGRPKLMKRRIFLGGAAEVGLFHNCFGGANALIDRRTFKELGGFTEDYGVGHEDWEFFAHAVLNGVKLETVPEALYWYRIKNDSMVHTTNLAINLNRSLRPYVDVSPKHMPNIFRLAQGHQKALTAAIDECRSMRCEIETLKSHLRGSEERNHDLEMQSQALARERDFLQLALEKIHGSTSWRLTAPVRAFRRLMSRVIGHHTGEF